MAIQLLIFSDIHLDERNQNIVLEKIEALANIVATQDITVEKLIVIVAGDFTYSAQREQFDNIRAAFALFDELVRKKSKKIEIEYAFVPGNHDVNMLKNRDVDEIIIDNISNKRNIEQRECKVLSERLECYNEFLKSLGIYNETDNYIYEDKLIRCENNFYIKLDLYNSSFLAKFNQEKGKLFIPLNAVRKNEKLDDYLTIAIIHHPLSWFEEKCRQKLQNYIEESSNIFISGHEHAVDLYNKKKINSSVFHVEAPAFHENEEGFVASVVSIYIENRKNNEVLLKVYTYEYEGDKYVKIDDKDCIEEISIGFSRGDYALNKEFENGLRYFSAPLLKSSNDSFKIDDVFVYPVLEEKFANRRDGVDKYIDSSDLLSLSKENFHCFIYGDSCSGKTTLAKKLFLDFFGNGLCPVYFDAQTIDCSQGAFTRNVNKLFKEQYIKRPVDEYFAVDADKRIIIFDNYDSNVNGRIELLEQLVATGCKLVVFGVESEYFERQTRPELYGKLENCFRAYSIQELGHKKRYDLIQKWVKYTDSTHRDEVSFDNYVVETEQTMNQALGKSIIPRYPLYITMFLQVIVNDSKSISEDIATYGSLYDVVIRKQLALIADKNYPLQFYITYLSELAYYMHSNSLTKLKQSQYMVFAAQYDEIYATHYKDVDILNKLLHIGIVRARINHDDEKEILFSYSYYFYYFVASYLSKNIECDEVKQVIHDLCLGFDDDSRANIWVFLTHLSSNSYIIDVLSAYADSLLSNYPENRLMQDIAFAQELQVLKPDYYIMQDEHRLLAEHRLSNRDKRDREKSDASTCNEVSRNLAQVKRTIEIMGYLIRNFAGSLKKNDKNRLLEVTYKLAFRSIGYMVVLFKDNLKGFMDVFYSVNKSQHSLPSFRELIEKIAFHIYNVMQYYAFGVLLSVSFAVSHKQLKTSYNLVITSMNENNAALILHELITLITDKRLKDFHTRESITKLCKHPFCKDIVMKIVCWFCYMYSVSRDDKQRLCSAFNLKSKFLLAQRPKM